MSEEEQFENLDSKRNDHVTGDDEAKMKEDANIETHKQPDENTKSQGDESTDASELKAEPSEKCVSQKLQPDSEACNLDHGQTTETRKDETELHDNVQTIDEEIRRMNLSEGKGEEKISAQARVHIQPPPPPPERHLSSSPNKLCADSVGHKSDETKTGYKDSHRRIKVGHFTDYDVISNKDVQHLSEWEKIHKDCLSEIPPIDPGVIHDIERKAKVVASNLDHLLHTLNNSLKSMSVTGVQSVDTYKTTVENMEAIVNGSIESMYTLIAKCKELHSYMGPLYSMSAQIKDIKRTLDVFESLCR